MSVVIAPAGCGKTTLLAHIAEAAGSKLAWLTLDPELIQPPVLLAHLHGSFTALPGWPERRWASPGDMVNALEVSLPAGAVLVIDEIQALAGTAALDVIRLLLTHQPARLSMVIGGRQLPELGLSRLRLTTTVREIGPDDLRFRTWEVEELFRSCHDVRLGAAEVAQLAQRTAGWAAGLQLFHLATVGRPPSSRAAVLGVGGARLTSKYLAEQVLAQLDPDLLRFVLSTSVLTRLSAERCDRLLAPATAAPGSAVLLDRLNAAGLLDVRSDQSGLSGPEYRYHEVLQAHLIDQLETRLGSAFARELHRRAGTGWVQESAHVDAVRSFCRAQDWAAVRSTIESAGEHLAEDRGSWIDLVPESIRQADPWVLLALARRLLADGSLAAAMDVYTQAITGFAGLSGTDTAARELRAVRSWVEPPLGIVDDPYHLLRLAFIDPRSVGRPTEQTALRWCGYAMALLSAGRLVEAVAAFDTAVGLPGSTPTVETLAVLGRAVAMTMTGHPDAATAREHAGGIAAAAGVPTMERLGDGLIRLLGRPVSGDPVTHVADLLTACRAVGDEWGEALLLFFAALRGLAWGHTSVATAQRAAELLTNIHAPALAVWASAASACSAARDGEPWDAAALAALERQAWGIGPGPHALALLAHALSSPDPAVVRRALHSGALMLHRTALRAWVERERAGRLPAPRTPSGAEVIDPRPVAPVNAARLRIAVLGDFRVIVDGAEIPTTGLRPLHRELLAMFSAHAGRVVTNDQLRSWFWPDSEPAKAHHSLQVAVSELRRLLNPRNETVRDGLAREGAGYRLQLAADTDCDARRFEVKLRAAEAAQADPARAVELFDAALASYAGDLLPGVGFPEWVLGERDRLRALAVGGWEHLMRLHAEAGQHRLAVAAARAGLLRDPHRDAFWRQLIVSLTALDQPAAAAAAERSYRQVLMELGV